MSKQRDGRTGSFYDLGFSLLRGGEAPTASATLSNRPDDNKYPTVKEILENIVPADSEENFLRGKTAIVTGGDCGVGLEVVKTLASLGCRVYLCSSSSILHWEEEQTILNQIISMEESDIELDDTSMIIIKKLDLSDLISIKSFVNDFLKNESRLDFLILHENYISNISNSKDLTSAGYEKHIGINYFGHFYLCSSFLSLLSSQEFISRVIVFTSQAYSMGHLVLSDLHYKSGRIYDSYSAYSASKLANIYFTIKLSQIVSHTKCIVVSIDIGNVKQPQKQLINDKKDITDIHGQRRRYTLSSMTSTTSLAASTKSYFPQLLKSSKKTCLTINQGAASVIWTCLSPILEIQRDQYQGSLICNMKIISLPEKCKNQSIIDDLWTITQQQIRESSKVLDIDLKLERAQSIANYIPEQNSQFSEDLFDSNRFKLQFIPDPIV